MEQAFNFPVPENIWSAVVPVAVVSLTGMLCLLLDMFKTKKSNDLLVLLSVSGLLLAGAFLIIGRSADIYETMGGMFLKDVLGTGIQLILILSAALAILFSEPYLREKEIPFGEFYPLILWSTVGAMLMASTKNLLMLFVGLEILSISLYVLAGLSRREAKSEESAMKYFLLGSFASGFLLFGTAFFYGATGSLHMETIIQSWSYSSGEIRSLLVIGLALILIGLGFKASLVPFHQWTPDVYQGAPTNVASFMATGSKVAAFAAIYRLLDSAYPASAQWLMPLSIVAGLTMLVGNFVALTQSDVKRILAYSSISHAGYILVAVLSNTADRSLSSGTTLLYYLLSYTFMTAGAFAAISLGAKNGAEVTGLDDLRGMWQRSPLAAATLVICMLSLMGIPPTAGFIGKALIFSDAVRAGLTPLAVILAISSVISVAYYLAIAKAALASEDEKAVQRLAKPTPSLLAACTVSIVGIIASAVFFTPVTDLLR